MAFAYIVPRQQSGSSGSASSTGTSTSTTGTTSSTTTSAAASLTTTPPTNTAPFFPDPSMRIEPHNGKSDLSKTVLEWVFVVLIILIVFGFIIYRLTLLRLSNRPLRDFFRLRRRWSRSSYLASHPQYLSSSYSYSGGPYPSIQNPNTNTRSYDISNIPLPLANVPSSHQLSQLSQLGRSQDTNANARRTRAVNVDEGGRRLDSRPNPEDGGEEEWDREKDALPAYDKYGGPPGYLEAGVGEGRVGGGMTGIWRVGPLGLLHARPSSRGDGEREPQAVTTATGGVDTHANFTEADANPSSTPMAAAPLTVPARVYEPTSATVPVPASVHANSESRSDS